MAKQPMLGKYAKPMSSDRLILKTTKLYADGKTQVPQEVIERLKLERGSQIVWVLHEGKIIVESPRI